MIERKLLVAILLGCLAAAKELGYLPQVPADVLEPLSKAMPGPALHSKHRVPEALSQPPPSFAQHPQQPGMYCDIANTPQTAT